MSSIPRVFGYNLSQNYSGKNVRIVGSVKDVTPKNVTILSCDGIPINIIPNQGEDIIDQNLYNCKHVEVIGFVKDNNTLMQYNVTNFGDNFDLDTYNESLKLIQQQ